MPAPARYWPPPCPMTFGRPQNRPRVPRSPPRGDNRPRPEATLWDTLVSAGPEGVSVGELAALCDRTRRWVYYRLQEHAQAGRAVQVRRGYWRAARPAGAPPHGGDRP